MIKKIKHYALLASSALMLLLPVAFPIAAAAACSTTADQLSKGANSATSGTGAVSASTCGTGVGLNNDDSISTLAANIVNIFSLIVGIIAVIMIIYGGFRYITSGGDSGGVGNAKNTLIYAIIGLIIVALAQLIVHFVLNQTSTITTT